MIMRKAKLKRMSKTFSNLKEIKYSCNSFENNFIVFSGFLQYHEQRKYSKIWFLLNFVRFEQKNSVMANKKKQIQSRESDKINILNILH